MCHESQATLAALRLRFPAFSIFREVTHGRRPRYVACRLHDGVHPHTVVTTDLAELHDELSRAGQPQVPASPAQAGPAAHRWPFRGSRRPGAGYTTRRAGPPQPDRVGPAGGRSRPIEDLIEDL
jgi:hypothetical protein